MFLNVYFDRRKLRIKKSFFSKFPLDTLLYIFYTITGDAMQLLVGQELHKRGCRYHKIFQVWLAPDDGACAESPGTWTSGFYKFFNNLSWKWERDTFDIVPGVLMDTPPIPPEDSIGGMGE